MNPVGIGLIGCGIISETYLDNLVRRFQGVRVIGCSDLIDERAETRAQAYGIRKMTNDEIFSDPDVEIVVNTTYMSAHEQIVRQALEAGKHVYTEKSLAPGFMHAKGLAELADRKGLRIGCAPDTFLGGGYQTCRRLIDDGYIGKPIAVQALLARNVWPDGAQGHVRIANEGTMPYDMAGYYTHAMIHLFGPVRRVAGFAHRYPFEIRNPMNPEYGGRAEVASTTSLYAALEFESGVHGTFILTGESFEETPRIEVYGSEGTLICPDPNYFGGPVLLKRSGGSGFMEMPILFDNVTTNKGQGSPTQWGDSRRGIGVAEMAWAMRAGRPHRCSKELHLHALEIIYGLEQCTDFGGVYAMTTRVERPAPLRMGFVGASHEAAIAE